MTRLATALCILALVCASALPTIYQPWFDPDWFWHCRLGQTMLAGGSPIAPDEVSYASVQGSYRRHSWGAEVAIARLDRLAGIEGYRAGRGVLRAALILLVAVACLRAGRSRVVALGCTALLVPLSRIGCEVRPAAMAYVILAAVAALTFARRRTPGVAACVAVVALQPVLTNVHPLSVVLLAWMGALWFGSSLELRLGGRRHRDEALARIESRRMEDARIRAGRYLFVTCGALLALAVDPRPFSALEAIVLLRFDPLAAGRWINEMLPPQMIGPLGWLGIAIGVLAVISLARSRRARPDEWVLLLGNLYLGLELARNMALLEIVALPLIARHAPLGLLRPVVARLRLLARRPALRPLSRPRGQAIAAACILAATIGVPLAEAHRAPLESDPTEAYERAYYPSRAAEWVAAHVPPGAAPRRVLTPFDSGGFLAWRLGPSYKVFQYGQSQLFQPEFWDDFLNHRPEGMRRRILAGDPEVAVVPDKDLLWRKILLDEGWRAAYEDERFLVLLPPEKHRSPTPGSP